MRKTDLREIRALRSAAARTNATVRTLDAEALEHSGLDHRFRSALALFGGLETEHEGPGERVAALGNRASGSEQDRDVPVVTARVHGTGDDRCVRPIAFLGRAARPCPLAT